MDKERVPDGGYGWVIVAAYAANNVIYVPIMQGFALLFRYVFQELQMSATDISTIINMNSAFGLLLGVFNGPLLKSIGYRKVAMIGTILMFIGSALTSTAESFTEFIIYYGIIHSIGASLTPASYSLALNTYFNKRRNLASGLCTAITGLGPVFMPFIISFLLEIYGVRGTSLILAALTLNTFAGTLLLQPVKWHYREILEEETLEKEMQLLNPSSLQTKSVIPEQDNNNDDDDDDESEEEFDIHSVHGVERVMIPSKTMENGGVLFASKISLHEKAPDATWWRKSSNAGLPPHTSQYSMKQEKKQKKKKSKTWSKMVKLFDLDLLQDPGYRMIWLGMSLAFTGELNFSLMMPLILGDKGWDVKETAVLLSSLALADIIMRFISPFIGEALKLPAKQMYMISLVFLVITRWTLIIAHNWTPTLIACIIIGMAKGFRTVYMGLVIPSYVPLEKLASASGLQTVLNGLFLISAGPIFGYIRDKSGNYNVCLYLINFLSLTTLILWTIELLLDRREIKAEEDQKKLPE